MTKFAHQIRIDMASCCEISSGVTLDAPNERNQDEDFDQHFSVKYGVDYYDASTCLLKGVANAIKIVEVIVIKTREIH